MSFHVRVTLYKLLGSMRGLAVILVAAAFSVHAGAAQAATFTYTGNANYGPDSNGACTVGLGGGDTSDWFDARNWAAPCSPAGVPGPNDDAVIGDFTVILSGSATVHNLTFSPTPPTGGAVGNALEV